MAKLYGYKILKLNDLIYKFFICNKFYIYIFFIINLNYFKIKFAFITMATVGYGDILPITIIEKIFVILSTLLACGIFGYSLSTI